jgi:hypothetical protein
MTDVRRRAERAPLTTREHPYSMPCSLCFLSSSCSTLPYRALSEACVLQDLTILISRRHCSDSPDGVSIRTFFISKARKLSSKTRGVGLDNLDLSEAML